MSKAKRLIAAILTVIMTVSLFAVMTFAATPVFVTDYVDETGTIKKTAYIVTQKAADVEKGTDITEVWDGKEYTFTVGTNAFATISAAYDASAMDMKLDTAQILLTEGDYGELRINRSAQIFGVKWNTDPNVKYADPTKPWTYNTAWDSNNTTVGHIVIEASASTLVGVYGVVVRGRIHDNMRPISSAKTVVRFRNILIDTDANITSGTFDTKTYGGASGRSTQQYYLFNCWNYNVSNGAETAVTCKDELYIENLRIEKLAGNINRFIDELLPPKVTLDGVYYDTAQFIIANGQGPVGGYMKYMPYINNVNFTWKNSFFTGTSHYIIHEGLTKTVTHKTTDKSNPTTIVGTMLEDQYTEFNLTGNLFYNSVVNSTFMRLYPRSFSKVNISGNYIVNTSPREKFPIDLLKITEDKIDYTNIISITDNFFLGQNLLNITCGLDTTKIDLTGNYINSAYSTNWLDGTANVTPAGNIRYDYLWKDAKRTEQIAGVEGFTMRNAVIDSEAKTITVTLAANSSPTFTPVVTGVSKYAFYESDENFTNYDNIENEEPITVCEARNVKNYFLFVVYSETGSGEYTVYKMTINKSATTRVALDDIEVTSPVNAVVEANEREFDITIGREDETVVFEPISTTATKFVVYDVDTGATMTADADGAYTVEEIQPGQTRTIRIRVVNGTYGVYYFAYIKRALSSECEIVKLDDTMTRDGKTIVADIDVTGEYTFDLELSDRATASVWQGTKVYAWDAQTNTVTIKGLNKAENKFKLAVIAEDGVTINEYNLIIKTPAQDTGDEPILSDDRFVVEGAEALGPIHLVSLKKDAKETTLKINAKDCTYKLYADADFTIESSNKITINQGVTYVFAKVKYNDGEEAEMAIIIASERSRVNYKDADKVPDWAKDYVDALNESGYGIIMGDDQGNFNPNKSISRYEVATIAARMLGVDVAQFANVKLNYTDKIADWAANSVKAVTALGIMNGSNNMFNGKGNVTRAQMSKIIVEVSFYAMGETVDNFYEFEKEEIEKFYKELNFVDESSIQTWAKKYIKVATYVGLIAGSENGGKLYMKPNNDVTRAQAATIVARYLGVEE